MNDRDDALNTEGLIKSGMACSLDVLISSVIKGFSHRLHRPSPPNPPATSQPLPTGTRTQNPAQPKMSSAETPIDEVTARVTRGGIRPAPPVFAQKEEEREWVKFRLAQAFRIFGTSFESGY